MTFILMGNNRLYFLSSIITADGDCSHEIKRYLLICVRHKWATEPNWTEQKYYQFSSVPQSCPNLCDRMDCSMPASLSITNSPSLLKLMSIQLVIPSNHLVFCCPLLLLPLVLTSIRVFSNESVLCIRWPKYWSFSFSISPPNEYSGLISFKMDWLDLLASKGLSRVFSNTTV